MPSPDEVAAGVAAGVCDALASHPIDQVKTQFHVNRHVNPSILTTLHEQLAAGGVPRLYRGVSAPLCAVAGPTSPPWRIGAMLSALLDRASACAAHGKGARARSPRALDQPAQHSACDHGASLTCESPLNLSPRPPLARINPESTRV